MHRLCSAPDSRPPLLPYGSLPATLPSAPPTHHVLTSPPLPPSPSPPLPLSPSPQVESIPIQRCIDGQRQAATGANNRSGYRGVRRVSVRGASDLRIGGSCAQRCPGLSTAIAPHSACHSAPPLCLLPTPSPPSTHPLTPAAALLPGHRAAPRPCSARLALLPASPSPAHCSAPGASGPPKSATPPAQPAAGWAPMTRPLRWVLAGGPGKGAPSLVAAPLASPPHLHPPHPDRRPVRTTPQRWPSAATARAPTSLTRAYSWRAWCRRAPAGAGG